MIWFLTFLILYVAFIACDVKKRERRRKEMARKLRESSEYRRAVHKLFDGDMPKPRFTLMKGGK